tara:strand:- start:413 stop:823 length:411 start_codon:yes stop_codon:yes gene_type:complete
MDFSVEVRPGDRCALVGLDGPFVLQTLEQVCVQIINHPLWQSDFQIIVIIGSQADFSEVTLAKLKEVQGFIRGWNAQYRTGLNPRTAIVCSDDFKRVMADLWLAMVGEDWPIELGIFTSVQDALTWCARPADVGQG